MPKLDSMASRLATHLKAKLRALHASCNILQISTAYLRKEVDEIQPVCYNDDAFIGRKFKIIGYRKSFAWLPGIAALAPPKGAKQDAYEYEGVILMDDGFYGFKRFSINLHNDAAALLCIRGLCVGSCPVKSS